MTTILKKSKLLYKLYRAIRSEILKLMYKISPVISTKVLYLLIFKKRINLNNPKTFNEKIQWLKLYWQHPLVAKCADKYDLREYVEDCGVAEILNEVYGVYRKANTIDFENLPNKFALKGTHGCGYNLICNDKESLDKEEAIKLADKWLNSNFAYVSAEPQYDKMEPKIIIEKFIDGIGGDTVTDYKIFCFNGQAKLTMVCEGRGENQRAKYYFYNNSWEIQPYNKDSKEIIASGKERHAEKPESFDKMREYAEVLSKPFPFVRVDFYDLDGKVILGEMTFTPCAGLDNRLDPEVDRLMGEMIKLPEKYKQ